MQLCFGLSYGKEGAIATDTSQLLPPSTEVYQVGGGQGQGYMAEQGLT